MGEKNRGKVIMCVTFYTTVICFKCLSSIARRAAEYFIHPFPHKHGMQ